MLKVKNWERFQHYKSKNGEKPVWIKFHLAVLDDYEFHSLPVEARALLPMLWLLASEKEGNLPEIKKIAFRLRLSENELIKSIKLLIENGSIISLESFYTNPIPEDIEKKEEGYRKERESTLSSGGLDSREDFRKVYDFGSEAFPALATRRTEIISKWLEAGADPERDILPEIARAKGREIKSWGYFTNGIMDAKATRERPLPAGQPRDHPNEKKSHSRKMMEASAEVAMELERQGI